MDTVHRVAARFASTPEQWELGGEILDKKEAHPAIKVVKTHYDAVVHALDEAARQSANLKRVGVGRTEDGTLIVARVVPALEELAKVAETVARQLRAKLGGSGMHHASESE